MRAVAVAREGSGFMMRADRAGGIVQGLTDTQRALQRGAEEFVARHIAPIAHDYDNNGTPLPESIVRAMAELGYFGLIFPEDVGGSALDPLALALVTEELARGWLCAGSTITRAVIAGVLIDAHGTPAQRTDLLPRICRGELIPAAAFTEPNAGSDTAAVALDARREGDSWILRGEKTWCTGADRARLLVVLARTDPSPSAPRKGLSIFLVEKDSGFGSGIAGAKIPTIGYSGVDQFSLHFDDVRVPGSALLGGELGKGFYQLMATYEHARIQTSARAVGVARAALEAALAYATERTQFGVPISEHQVIRHKLAKMAIDVEAARQLTWSAAQKKASGERSDLEAGYAKAFAAEMVERVTSEALQVFGSYGYSRETPVQRYWRDARVFRIFEGTVEIQHEVIGRRLLERQKGAR